MINATRETFGNVPPESVVFFYVLAGVATALFAYGVLRRYLLWRQGTPLDLGQAWQNGVRTVSGWLGGALRRILVEGLGQKRVLGRGLASAAHLALFAGFMILFLGTTLLEADHLLSKISDHLHFHRGMYDVIYEAALDVFGLLFLAGLCYFFWRGLRRPPSVGHRFSDWVVLILFFGIGLTGYLVEGLRITWAAPEGLARWCSPVGALLAMPWARVSESAARSTHLVFWWIHAVLSLAFIAVIPWTRLMHLITGPLNLLVSRPSLGRLEPLTLEQVEQTGVVGVAQWTQFKQNQLLSFDACMECGRCEEACPAFATQKPLSPKAVVQDLQGLMSHDSGRKLHGETILAETLWSCTSCNACTRVCPVRVDPLGLILDMRRSLAGEGLLPGTAAGSLRQMQTHGNPWGFPAAERMAWAEGLDVPTCAQNPNAEILWWVGCAGSFDRRAQKVTRAIARILKEAKVNFAVLGPEERCTGESARRLGDEFLFQELAAKNQTALDQYAPRRILTQCPHCLNSLLQDYPQFGQAYPVVHHTQFINELIASGRLIIPRHSSSESITYHDPCYLARVQRIHQEPRELLRQVGGDIREMKRAREKTFCCGAGGGRMWLEESPGQSVSAQRAQEALQTGASTVAVGCPFCLTMMSDGVRSQSSETSVKDVAELIVQHLDAAAKP